MMTLHENLKFKRKDTPYIYTLDEIKGDTLICYAYNELDGKGRIVEMSEEYFNECDKLGYWEEM